MDQIPKPICTHDYIFSYCILSNFTSILSAYFIFPRELIRLILLQYYVLKTHFDISVLDNTGRDRLFLNLWMYAILETYHNVDIKFDINDAKKHLIALPGSEIKTYATKYRDVPLFVDIYNTSGIIDISNYDRLASSDRQVYRFKYVFNIVKQSMNKPTYIKDSFMWTSLTFLQSNAVEENNVLIVDKKGEVFAKGTILKLGFEESEIKIQEIYLVTIFEEGDIGTFLTSHIAFYLKDHSNYVLNQ